MRFVLPKARNDSSPLIPGLPHPICSVFRFSQPLNGLLLKSPCGLVSYHWHSWDSLFRAFPLKAATYPRRIHLPLESPYHFSLYTSPASECRGIVEFCTPREVCATQRIQYQQVLIHSQVRSHPALVLPSAEGRYSLELWCLLGGITGTSRCYHHPLMQLQLRCKQRGSLLQSIKNDPTRIPQGNSPPCRLCTLFASHCLRYQHGRAYGFTSSTVCPKASRELLNHVDIKPEYCAMHCQGPALQRYPSRPNGCRVGTINSLPLQSIKS
jgi:hypothetical protein